MPYAIPTHKGSRRRAKRDYREEPPGDPFYWSAKWLKCRKAQLMRHPLCADPDCIHDIAVPATEVDHIIPRKERPDLAYANSNLQSLCKPCHSIKTARERRRSRKHRST